MRFDPGQVLGAQWDGDGSWRVVRVLEAIDDSLQVWVYQERFEEFPTPEQVEQLDESAGRQHPLERDELALMWPSEIDVSAARSTRRGLLEGLVRRGVERGDRIVRSRKPPWM